MGRWRHGYICCCLSKSLKWNCVPELGSFFFDNWWEEMAAHLSLSQSLCAQLEEPKDSRKRERKHQQMAGGSKDEIYFIMLPWTDLRYYEFITTLKLFYLKFKHLKYEWHIRMSASGKQQQHNQTRKAEFSPTTPLCWQRFRKSGGDV